MPATRIEELLPFRRPLMPDNLFGHLVATAVPGVEEWRDGAYRRTVRLPHGPAIIALRPGDGHGSAGSDGDGSDGHGSDGDGSDGHGHGSDGSGSGSDGSGSDGGAIGCTLLLSAAQDRDAAVRYGRFLLDLDADPLAVDAVLSADPRLKPLVDAAPGRRIPRAGDGAELAIRAVLGQQVSTAAARTHAARLVLAHGEPIDDPDGGLTHLFPQPAALAGLDQAALAVPGARRRALVGLIDALASGRLTIDPPGDRARDTVGFARTRAELLALPGIGPWTADTVAMRALGDDDAFLPTDLGIRLAAAALGLPTAPGALTRYADRWRPYRGYAVQYLWATGTHPINALPREH